MYRSYINVKSQRRKNPNKQYKWAYWPAHCWNNDEITYNIRLHPLVTNNVKISINIKPNTDLNWNTVSKDQTGFHISHHISTDVNIFLLDSGYYMKFDTSSGPAGNSALLESRILYPKREEQCLQFFYKINGAPGDKLVIWVRTDDGTGNVRSVKKIHTITGMFIGHWFAPIKMLKIYIWRIKTFCLSGDGDAAWKVAHVTLKVNDKFRYIFQGIRGSANSSGAILIDDITLTETVCPIAVWQIRNFTGLLNTTAAGRSIKSRCFFNSEGYSFGISVYPNGRDVDYPDYVSMTMHLCSGENDAVLEWPVKNRQVTIIAMDQDPDATLRMSSTRSFTTGTQRNVAFGWNQGHNGVFWLQKLHQI